MSSPTNIVCNAASLDGIKACGSDAWTYLTAQYDASVVSYHKFIEIESKNPDSVVCKINTLNTYAQDTFKGYWNSTTFQPYLSHGTAVFSGVTLAHGISRLKEKGLKDLRAWTEITAAAGSFYLLESNPIASSTRVLQTFALSLFTAGIYFTPNAKTQAVPPARSRFEDLRRKLIS